MLSALSALSALARLGLSSRRWAHQAAAHSRAASRRLCHTPTPTPPTPHHKPHTPPRNPFTPPDNARRNTQALDLEQLRLIDKNGEQLGILAPTEALAKAKEQSLELAEVGPKANPPVWRLVEPAPSLPKAKRPPSTPKASKSISHAAAAVARRKQLGKKPKMKDVRILDKCSTHDLDSKVANVLRFLGKGVTVRLFVGASTSLEGVSQRGRAEKIVAEVLERSRDAATHGGVMSSGSVVSAVLEPRI